MFTHFLQNIRKYHNRLLFIIVIIAIALTSTTYYVILIASKELGPDPSQVIRLILADLVIFLILGILSARKIFQNFFNKKDSKTSKLQNRIIIAFSLVATIPTIIVAVFSTYFFNFGMQVWFDKKVSIVLDQSIKVAESSIDSHKRQLQEITLSLANKLKDIEPLLLNDPSLFIEVLNFEAEISSLAEILVLHRPTNIVWAHNTLSFALSFTTIPDHYIKEAAMGGGVVEIKSDPTKIRMLMRLKENSDLYLLVGKLIDSTYIDHITQTQRAANEYYHLKEQRSSMQIKFSIVFIFIALLLLLAAISWGIVFTTTIVKPIKNLVLATEKVKDGDLTIQVPEDALDQNEISVLSSAFNRMIKQIDHQQKDLVIAQRALAWSDIARRVAHEIKNPLTPIHLASERLLKKFGDQVNNKVEFNKYIEMIIRHTNDIKTIVSEFISFARLPSPVFVNCDLVTLIRNMVESRKLINDNISYNFISTDQYIDFICDITQINQIMVNLLKNAEESIKTVRLQTANKSYKGNIIVSITKIGDLVTIAVTDNGVGFLPHLIDRVMEPYVTTRPKGTGLGLAIVRKIAQEHGAILNIANQQESAGAVINIIFNLNTLKAKISSNV